MAVVIQASTNDAANLFNLNGVDFHKGKYTLSYDSLEVNSSGVIDETKVRVGLINKFKQVKTLVSPRLVTDWDNGTAAYSDFDTLIADLSGLISSGGGGVSTFTMEVKSDDFGTSADDQFTIPTRGTKTYLYDYTTSDGQSGTGITGDETITFASGVGTYTISITGTFPQIYFAGAGDRRKLTKVLSWGVYGLGETVYSLDFYKCSNLISIAEDCDNLNLMTDGSNMFAETGLIGLPATMTLPSLVQGLKMFQKCSDLADLGGLVLGNLQFASNMFRDNVSLAGLPSTMLLSSLTNGDYMFEDCLLITSLPSAMTLSNLTSAYAMFWDCSLASLPSGMTLPLLSMGTLMFINNSLVDLPAGMTLPALAYGSDMFNGNIINTTRYSQLLVDLESGNPNNSVTFHGGNSLYNATGETARDILTGVGRTWTITDGGLEP